MYWRMGQRGRSTMSIPAAGSDGQSRNLLAVPEESHATELLQVAIDAVERCPGTPAEDHHVTAAAVVDRLGSETPRRPGRSALAASLRPPGCRSSGTGRSQRRPQSLPRCKRPRAGSSTGLPTSRLAYFWNSRRACVSGEEAASAAPAHGAMMRIIPIARRTGFMATSSWIGRRTLPATTARHSSRYRVLQSVHRGYLGSRYSRGRRVNVMKR